MWETKKKHTSKQRDFAGQAFNPDRRQGGELGLER